MSQRITTAERNRIFGEPCSTANLTTVTTPWGIRVRIHRLLVPVFLDACQHAAAEVVEWRPARIDSFACRPIRGTSSTYSLHSYGLAFDFFVTGPNVPPPGGVWTPDNGLPPPFARCFTERGFTWGAQFARKDVPHIEWADGRPSTWPVPQRPPSAPTLARTDNYEVDMIVNDYTLTLTTDNEGRGWQRVPFPRSRIIGHTPPGLRPENDQRYLVGQVGFADDNGGCVVSVTEWAPNTTCVVQLSVRG